ncbi:MAG: PD40 domain-containing protein [Bacteroidales bacterium]|nr:PD40 domain-containing protein [Bacteroidales bacterium]
MPNQSKLFLIFGLFIVFLNSSCTDSGRQVTVNEASSEWKYFGLQPPGNTPQIFSPDIISTYHNERDFTISPSGSEMFYSMVLPNNTLSVILYLHFDGFFWSEPQVAPFSGQYSDLEPSFTPDGKKIFFISKRPLNKEDTTEDWNIWYIELTDKGWSQAFALGPEINTEKDEYYPSLTEDRTLYFTAMREDTRGSEDIYFSKPIDKGYSTPVNLGDSINTEGYEYNAYITPDDSILIFGAYGRDDGLGGGDLYISFKKPDGTWTKSKNMGKGINSDKLDYCPFITRDRQHLFFTSQRIDPELKIVSRKHFAKVIQLADGIENGLGNIYWVAFDPNNWK